MRACDRCCAESRVEWSKRLARLDLCQHHSHEFGLQLLAEGLAEARPGRRLAGFERVDSRTDPRVQLADLVAGVVRRTVEDHLNGRAAEDPVPVGHLVADASPLTPEDWAAWVRSVA